jgi:hypothetical protein
VCSHILDNIKWNYWCNHYGMILLGKNGCHAPLPLLWLAKWVEMKERGKGEGLRPFCIFMFWASLPVWLVRGWSKKNCSLRGFLFGIILQTLEFGITIMHRRKPLMVVDGVAGRWGFLTRGTLGRQWRPRCWRRLCVGFLLEGNIKVHSPSPSNMFRVKTQILLFRAAEAH